jgi:two-component system CheB/CheR fusion protein
VLSQVNDDMQNLLNSTDVATVFLDRNLRIKRFTAPAKKAFQLRESDVGRPLSDMAASLLYENLLEDAERVLQSLVSFEKELQTADGRWWVMRMLPYRTTEHVIDGLVVTFLDIHQLKGAEQQAKRARDFSRRALASLRDGLVVLNEGLRIVSANPAFCRLCGLAEEEVVGRTVTDPGIGLRHPVLEKALDALRHGEVFDELRIQSRVGTAHERDVLFMATDLADAGVDGRFLLVAEDLALRKRPKPEPADEH